MVQTRPATLQEARDRRIRGRRLEQLDEHVGRLDEGDFELAFGEVEPVGDAQAELVAIKMQRLVDARHGDADVMHCQRRLLHRSKYLR